jgi:hypothetical protein
MKYGMSNETGKMLARELLAREMQARELLSREVGSQHESQDRRKRTTGSRKHRRIESSNNSLAMSTASVSVMSRSRWEAETSDSCNQHESASLPAEFLYFKFEQMLLRWAKQRVSSVMSLERFRPPHSRPPRTITTIANALPAAMDEKCIPNFMRSTSLSASRQGASAPQRSRSRSPPKKSAKPGAQSIKKDRPTAIKTSSKKAPPSQETPTRRRPSPSPRRGGGDTQTILKRNHSPFAMTESQLRKQKQQPIKKKPLIPKFSGSNHQSSSDSHLPVETRSPQNIMESSDAPHYQQRESPLLRGNSTEDNMLHQTTSQYSAAPPAQSRPDPEGPTHPTRPDPEGERWASSPKRIPQRNQSPLRSKSPSPGQEPTRQLGRPPTPRMAPKESSPIRNPSPMRASSPVRSPSPVRGSSPLRVSSPVRTSLPMRSSSQTKGPSPKQPRKASGGPPDIEPAKPTRRRRSRLPPIPSFRNPTSPKANKRNSEGSSSASPGQEQPSSPKRNDAPIELQAMPGSPTRITREGEERSSDEIRSPRNGAGSPRNGAQYPRNTPASPRQGTSPRNGPQSPRNSTPQSPRTTATSPRTGTTLPRNGGQSPRNSTPSPRNTASSPRNTTTSPRNMAKSPRNGLQSPRNGPSPKMVQASPRTMKGSPRNTTAFPRNVSRSPRTPQGQGKASPQQKKSPMPRRYGRMHTFSARVLQSYFRMLPVRKGFLLFCNAVVVLQSLARCRIQMRVFKQKLKGSRMQNHSAILIQKNIRMASCRSSYLQLRGTAIVVQSALRMFSCRSTYSELRCASRKLLGRNSIRNSPILPKAQVTVRGGRLRIYSALLIQSMVRMQWVRSAYLELQDSAIVIQKWYRKVRKLTKLQKKTATILQRWVRMLTWRKCFLDLRGSAIVMQSCIRMTCARSKYIKTLAAIEAERQIQLEQFSAALLQSLYRRNACRFAYQQLRSSTILLQFWVRAWATRAAYQKLCRAVLALQCKMRRKLSERTVLEIHSAVVVQSSCRSFALTSAFLNKRALVCMIQALVRGYMGKRRYSMARAIAISMQRRHRGNIGRALAAVKRSVIWRENTKMKRTKKMTIQISEPELIDPEPADTEPIDTTEKAENNRPHQYDDVVSAALAFVSQSPVNTKGTSRPDIACAALDFVSRNQSNAEGHSRPDASPSHKNVPRPGASPKVYVPKGLPPTPRQSSEERGRQSPFGVPDRPLRRHAEHDTSASPKASVLKGLPPTPKQSSEESGRQSPFGVPERPLQRHAEHDTSLRPEQLSMSIRTETELPHDGMSPINCGRAGVPIHGLSEMARQSSTPAKEKLPDHLGIYSSRDPPAGSWNRATEDPPRTPPQYYHAPIPHPIKETLQSSHQGVNSLFKPSLEIPRQYSPQTNASELSTDCLASASLQHRVQAQGHANSSPIQHVAQPLPANFAPAPLDMIAKMSDTNTSPIQHVAQSLPGNLVPPPSDNMIAKMSPSEFSPAEPLYFISQSPVDGSGSPQMYALQPLNDLPQQKSQSPCIFYLSPQQMSQEQVPRSENQEKTASFEPVKKATLKEKVGRKDTILEGLKRDRTKRRTPRSGSRSFVRKYLPMRAMSDDSNDPRSSDIRPVDSTERYLFNARTEEDDQEAKENTPTKDKEDLEFGNKTEEALPSYSRPFKPHAQNKNNDELIIPQLKKKDDYITDRAISEKLAAIKKRSRARTIQRWTKRTLERQKSPKKPESSFNEEGKERHADRKDKREFLNVAVEQWAKQTIQRRKLSIFTSGIDDEIATQIQCAWRSHRDQLLLASEMVQNWSVSCVFSPDTVNHDRFIRQHAYVLALEAAYAQVGYHWKHGQVLVKRGLVLVQWEELVPINFSQHGLNAEDTCCTINVRCSAARNSVLNSWSEGKCLSLLTKTAIEKYCDDQRQKLRRSSMFERSLTRRRADFPANPGRPRRRKALHDNNDLHENASVIQRAYRKALESRHARQESKSLFGVPGDFQQRLHIYSATLIQSWYRMCVCRSMYQGLRRIQSRVFSVQVEKDPRTITFNRAFLEKSTCETIVEEGFECTESLESSW